ncbi:hypothetical protein [Streptomyces sp. NPDC051219]|uniref:hypothetical protein n=1 Tax=Streptomyces sp. NPDC051219 TaxID=3155283 RepID=UPI003446615D
MTLDIDRAAESIARMDYDDLRTKADVLPALRCDSPEGSGIRAQEAVLDHVIEAQESYERG